MTKAKTQISALEDRGQSQGAPVKTVVKTIMQLQGRIIYLKDASRRINICIVGVVEDAEGRDMQGFVKRLISEALDIEVTPDFEKERPHRTGQWSSRDRHVLVRFLRFRAWEAVLRVAREKGRVTREGKRVSSFQDLSQNIIQRSKRSLMELKSSYKRRDCGTLWHTRPC